MLTTRRINQVCCALGLVYHEHLTGGSYGENATIEIWHINGEEPDAVLDYSNERVELALEFMKEWGEE